MSISEADIKRLWGKAAGRCSKPDCRIDLIAISEQQSDILFGEMAHVIAKSKSGPRGNNKPVDNSYNNLILLCPNHHRIIDKYPDDYPTELLLKWKHDHEMFVSDSLKIPLFRDCTSLKNFVKSKLIENRICWATYGPEGKIATANPFSTAVSIWHLRKLSLIVPNNRQIIDAIKTNNDCLSSEEYEVFCNFVEHAEGFERNIEAPSEHVPRFPKEFGDIFYDE